MRGDRGVSRAEIIFHLIRRACVFCLILLSGGCLSFDYKKGLHVENFSIVDSTSSAQWRDFSDFGFNSDELIRHQKVRHAVVRVGLELRPQNSTLLFGPIIIIPLPVIPGLTGIISALFLSKENSGSSNKIAVKVSVDGEHLEKDTRYGFDIRQTRLIIDGRELMPSAYEFHSAYKINGKRTQGCAADQDGKVDFILQQSPGLRPPLRWAPQSCGVLSFRIEFDAQYRSVRNAMVRFGPLKIEDEEMELPPVELTDKKYFVWRFDVVPHMHALWKVPKQTLFVLNEDSRDLIFPQRFNFDFSKFYGWTVYHQDEHQIVLNRRPESKYRLKEQEQVEIRTFSLPAHGTRSDLLSYVKSARGFFEGTIVTDFVERGLSERGDCVVFSGVSKTWLLSQTKIEDAGFACLLSDDPDRAISFSYSAAGPTSILGTTLEETSRKAREYFSAVRF